ncbi:MAG: hypothetical protein GEV09_15810 [Pseudonocardiaceae bacterium]|nr:hypothetical protein [Pseudonocardiaceae bacterium]
MLRIGIIVGSTRPGRKARAIAEWVHGQGAGRPDAKFEVVDLADYDLAHLDEPIPAVFGQYSHDHTRAWSATISGLDAFVVVVPEYNHSFDEAANATCLVGVRRPLERPDPETQRARVGTVLTALGADVAPPRGLRAATFFASADAATVINLAEWANADAHRAALAPAYFGEGAGLGDSPAWRATREVPGISPQYDVRRYELVGAVEAGAA